MTSAKETVKEAVEWICSLIEWNRDPNKYRLRCDAKWYSEVYLRSEHWRDTRIEAIKDARCRCQICGYTADYYEGLEVHHTTYERLGFEHPEDLLVLCNRCHRKVHSKLLSS